MKKMFLLSLVALSALSTLQAYNLVIQNATQNPITVTYNYKGQPSGGSFVNPLQVSQNIPNVDQIERIDIQGVSKEPTHRVGGIILMAQDQAALRDAQKLAADQRRNVAITVRTRPYRQDASFEVS